MLGPEKNDFEMQTAGGATIKIKPARGVCIVFRGGQPESPGGQMEQRIPAIAFIGQNIRPASRTDRVSLAPCKHSRLMVYYASGGQERRLFLSINSQSDEFPVFVQHFETARQFLSTEGQGHPFRYLVCDSSVPRIDMMTLKVRNAEIQILLVHDADDLKQEHPPSGDKVRATDMLAQGAGREHTSNPVFMARVHLRNLQLDHVKQLLYDHKLQIDEIEFIRTFLGIMIKNEHGKEDLRLVHKQLQILDSMFCYVLDVLKKKSLDDMRPLVPESAQELKHLMAHYRQKAESKEDEIFYWELEFRLARA